MKIHPLDLLNKIAEPEGTGSQKLKKAIIEEHLDMPEFVKLIEYALNPFKQFYTTTIPGLSEIKMGAKRTDKERRSGHRDLFAETKPRMSLSKQFAAMFGLLDDMLSQKLAPNSGATRDAVCTWAKQCSPKTIDVFQRILRKDLRLGIGPKTFNKVKKGWVPSFDVQLAQPFNEKKLKFPCLVDPKFDGERCLAFIIVDGNDVTVQYFSRNGKEFMNYGCFTNELLSIFKGEGSIVIDCEAINRLGFQSGQRIPTYHDPNYNHENSQLAVFDWVTLDDFDRQSCQLDQLARVQQLTQWFKHHKVDKVFRAESLMAKDFQEVEQIYKKWVTAGLEGIILKQPDGEYEFKRSYAWMKMKPHRTEDLKVVGYELGDPNKQWANKFGSLIVERNDPNHGVVRVNVASGFTHHMHDTIQVVGDNQILYTQPSGEVINLHGQIVEVTYDCVTESGSLRFPRIHRRDEEIVVRADKVCPT